MWVTTKVGNLYVSKETFKRITGCRIGLAVKAAGWGGMSEREAQPCVRRQGLCVWVPTPDLGEKMRSLGQVPAHGSTLGGALSPCLSNKEQCFIFKVKSLA